MKLYKYICGIDEKYGAANDEKDAYDRRTDVDPTFHFLPVQIEEVTIDGFEVIVRRPRTKTEPE